MTDQITSDNTSGINTMPPPAVVPDLKVDVTKLPTKTPKKTISSKRKAEKAAKITLKEFKRAVKRELKDTFKVTSLLSFALKHKQMAEYNLEGTINKAYENALLRLNSRKNLTDANKKAAGAAFMTMVTTLRAFELGSSVNEEALILGKSKKKVSRTEKSLSPKERKKVKRNSAVKSLDKVKNDLEAVGAMQETNNPISGKKVLQILKGEKPKKIKSKKANKDKLDNHQQSA